MSSTACWPWPSPTCCAARPTTPACTCRSASCWPSWPASRKPCCSTTTAAKAAPAPGACSPTWTPPNSAWPTCSTFTATHRPADHAHTGELGNTPTPPAHTVLPAETPSTINQGRKLTLGGAPRGPPSLERDAYREREHVCADRTRPRWLRGLVVDVVARAEPTTCCPFPGDDGPAAACRWQAAGEVPGPPAPHGWERSWGDLRRP